MTSDLQLLTGANGGELPKNDERSKSESSWLPILRWFDLWAGIEHMRTEEARATVDWVRAIPLILVHVLCLGVLRVGWSWTAVGAAIGPHLPGAFFIAGIDGNHDIPVAGLQFLLNSGCTR